MPVDMLRTSTMPLALPALLHVQDIRQLVVTNILNNVHSLKGTQYVDSVL